jgi:hypothetical protein
MMALDVTSLLSRPEIAPSDFLSHNITVFASRALPLPLLLAIS